MGLLDLREAIRRSGLIDEFGVTNGLLNPLPEHSYSGPANTPGLMRTLGGTQNSMYQNLERPDPAKVEPGLGSPMFDPSTDLLPMGALRRIAEFGVAGLKASPIMAGVTAYHGSPFKFDKFKLDKIGTGEGMQAYGHGLYFAENPDVAKSYIGPEVANQYAGKLGAQGNLYKVDIHDSAVSKMLDWDKPLSQQPESVINAIKKSGFDWSGKETFGEWYQKQLVGKASWQLEDISSNLNKLGVPGIKYLDQGSREAGKGTYNFVVFDDELPNILESK